MVPYYRLILISLYLILHFGMIEKISGNTDFTRCLEKITLKLLDNSLLPIKKIKELKLLLGFQENDVPHGLEILQNYLLNTGNRKNDVEMLDSIIKHLKNIKEAKSDSISTSHNGIFYTIKKYLKYPKKNENYDVIVKMAEGNQIDAFRVLTILLTSEAQNHKIGVMTHELEFVLRRIFKNQYVGDSVKNGIVQGGISSSMRKQVSVIGSSPEFQFKIKPPFGMPKTKVLLRYEPADSLNIVLDVVNNGIYSRSRMKNVDSIEKIEKIISSDISIFKKMKEMQKEAIGRPFGGFPSPFVEATHQKGGIINNTIGSEGTVIYKLKSQKSINLNDGEGGHLYLGKIDPSQIIEFFFTDNPGTPFLEATSYHGRFIKGSWDVRKIENSKISRNNFLGTTKK